MEKYTNEYGKECFRGATRDTILNRLQFHEVKGQMEEDRQWALHTNIGSLTVLDRMTGYSGYDGYGVRDTESGYRAPDGKFWLASGDCDVIRS